MPVPPPSNAKRKLHGALMDFWQWKQELYDGTKETFECVTRPDTASVIPFLDAETVLLTRQEQSHIHRVFFDFPGGRIEGTESMEEGVRRELQEETGYRAQRIHSWHRVPHGGLSRYEEELFVAFDLEKGHAHFDPGEKITLVPTKWQELVQMCLRRELRNPNAMLAILAMEFDPEAKRRLHTWLKGA